MHNNGIDVYAMVEVKLMCYVCLLHYEFTSFILWILIFTA